MCDFLADPDAVEEITVGRVLNVARVRELNAKDYFYQMLKDNPEIGPERCIIGSDFGQVMHLDSIDGMRVFIRALLGFGMKESEVKMMIADNPAKLMWLDDARPSCRRTSRTGCIEEFGIGNSKFGAPHHP